MSHNLCARILSGKFRVESATRFATHFPEISTITKIKFVNQRAVSDLIYVDTFVAGRDRVVAAFIASLPSTTLDCSWLVSIKAFGRESLVKCTTRNRSSLSTMTTSNRTLILLLYLLKGSSTPLTSLHFPVCHRGCGHRLWQRFIFFGLSLVLHK